MANMARCKECNYAGSLGEFKPFKNVKLFICPECDSTLVKVFYKVPMCTSCGVEPSLPPGNLCATCEVSFRADAHGEKIYIPLIYEL